MIDIGKGIMYYVNILINGLLLVMQAKPTENGSILSVLVGFFFFSDKIAYHNVGIGYKKI